MLNNAELSKLEELEKSFNILFLLDISMRDFYIALVGLLCSAFIIMIIALIGLLEIYKPLQRVKAFTA